LVFSASKKRLRALLGAVFLLRPEKNFALYQPFSFQSRYSSQKQNGRMQYHLNNTDQDLRQGCMQQDRLAQQYLYKRYFGRLLGIAMRYTNSREDATDVLNQAFLKIFNSLHQYQETGPFLGWMAKIVFHTAIDHVRHIQTYRKVISYSVEADQSVENDVTDRLDAEDLYRLIQHITPASRTVFSLYVMDGYKHHEIAEMLGISVGTSKWHLSTARAAMKKQVEQYYQTNQ